MDIDTFYNSSNIYGYDFQIEDQYIVYKTTKKGIKQISDITDNIIIIDLLKDKYRYLIHNRIIMMICLILITLIYVSSNFYIRDIVFINQQNYDYEVYQTIKSQLSRVGPVYKLNDDIVNINRKLRLSYPQYSYIGVTKLGSKLLVEITQEDTPKKNISPNLVPGDMISKYDGYIVGVITKKGVVIVNTSETVKKNSLLISGNLNYYNTDVDPNYISAEGIVLGKTVLYEKIIVPKIQYKTVYNGYSSNYYQLKVGPYEKNINQVNLNNIGYFRINNIFQIPNMISLNKITSFTTEEIMITYTKEEAINYAKSMIIHNFNLDKIHDSECIESIYFVTVNEYDTTYEVSFMVKYVRNFCIFRKKV